MRLRITILLSVLFMLPVFALYGQISTSRVHYKGSVSPYSQGELECRVDEVEFYLTKVAQGQILLHLFERGDDADGIPCNYSLIFKFRDSLFGLVSSTNEWFDPKSLELGPSIERNARGFITRIRLQGRASTLNKNDAPNTILLIDRVELKWDLHFFDDQVFYERVFKFAMSDDSVSGFLIDRDF